MFSVPVPEPAVPRYRTRNDALSAPTELRIEGGRLVVESDGKPPASFPLGTVAELRLAFVPTRAERARFACRVTFAGGRRVTFLNRTYEGPLRFRDTSAEYRDFVVALHRETAARFPAVPCRAGSDGAAYLANAGCLGGSLLLVAFLLFAMGFGFLVLVKLAILAFFLPAAVAWFRRNRPRPYAPDAIPAEVLPPAGD